MKPRVRIEQTRCRIACVEESFVLEFLFLFVQAKRKDVYFEMESYLTDILEISQKLYVAKR